MTLIWRIQTVFLKSGEIRWVRVVSGLFGSIIPGDGGQGELLGWFGALTVGRVWLTDRRFLVGANVWRENQ